MRKSFKKTFLYGFVFAMFSIFACLGGLSLSSVKTASAAVSNAIEISSAEDLYNRATNYGEAGAVSNYVLTADIDMKDFVLHRTIGTAENPFKGNFDGQGHTISNLNIDLSTNLQGDEVSTANKFVGLFGWTDGATISNIQLSGTTNITIGKCTTAYVGGLVGSARNNTTIKYIQNNASINLGQQVFEHSIVFGGLVGSANSTNISYVISRQKDAVSFRFEDNNGRVSSIGGVVGNLRDSSLVFGVSRTNLNVVVENGFVGTVNIGGVFGTVSGSGMFNLLQVAVVNMMVENNLNVTNNAELSADANVFAGQIGGVIESPYPESLGVSSIYYRKNASNITAYGQTNSYEFENPTTFDGTLEVNSMFTNEATVNSKSWYNSFGLWDFDKVWYFDMSSSTIYLQSFSGGFTVQLAQRLTSSNIFKIEKQMQERYLFESTAEIVFSFKTLEDGGSMSQYYTITGLNQGNVENKVVIDYHDGVYKVVSSTENETAPDVYEITENNGINTIKIKNVNKSTAGTYDINYKANDFTVQATTKLFDADGVLQNISEPPGNIYYVGGTTAVKLPVNITMNYNTVRTIEARLRNSNLPYALEGWYMENENGEDVFLGTQNALEINFGTGLFTQSRNIYAKYINDACKISFEIKGEGISEIYVGENLVAGKVATVSKTASRVKLEIYVKDGYKFDVKRFLDMISTYRGEDTSIPFCTWTNEETGDKNYYSFNLDMTTLKGEFAEDFSVVIDTEKTGGSKNNLVWYIVGGVGGAVLLGVAIFLIIFFVKRKGSGGGKIGGYSSKKSFKGGYY